MVSVLCYLAAFALICVAGALLLWQRAGQTQRRVTTARFVDRQIGGMHGATMQGGTMRDGAAQSGSMQSMAMGGAMSGAMPDALSQRRGPQAQAAQRARETNAFQRRLSLLVAPVIEYGGRLAHRAGVRDIGRFYLFSALGLAALTLVAAIRTNGIGATALLIFAVLILRLWLWNRAVHQQRRIVRQLPGFLDGVVRLITIGSSLPAAFQSAGPASDAPLRGCLERASRMMRAGVEIDKALYQLSELYRVQEFMLVSAVVRLSVKYGGRADLVLERMATFMRDREMAERELVALSSETRLSAWILALLPICIGSFIIFTNPGYFLGMWNDPAGRHLLYGAAALQVIGVFMLFRLAKL